MKENLPVSLQKLIHKVEETFAEDPAMVELFINCFSNTLDTTVKKMEDGTTHVITGDIPVSYTHLDVYKRQSLLLKGGDKPDYTPVFLGVALLMVVAVVLLVLTVREKKLAQEVAKANLEEETEEEQKADVYKRQIMYCASL